LKRTLQPVASAPPAENLEEKLSILNARLLALRQAERTESKIASVSGIMLRGAASLDLVELGHLAAPLVADPSMEVEPPGKRATNFQRIRHEMQIVEFAAAQLARRFEVERFRRVHDAFAADGHDWREVVRERALAVVRLQGLNAKSARLADQIRQGTSLRLPAEFPIAGCRLLGLGQMQMGADSGAHEFLQQVIHAGICTAAELNKARLDAQT
jgi:hypothetical protein